MNKLLSKWKKLNVLVKALLVFLFIMFSLSFLFAPTLKPVKQYDVSFEHTSSSLLYFKNIRSFYYDIEHDKISGFTLYRLKRRNTDTNAVWLQFTIVSNPLIDESYIYAELNTANEQWENPNVLIKRAKKDTLFAFHNLNNEKHFALAAEVFNQLLQNEQMFLLNGADTIKELYATKTENFNAAIVLEDYFKLINKL